MSPVSDSVPSALADEAVVPAKLLDGGEVVLLAIRPSVWFLVLTSLPVLAVAGLLGAAAYLGGKLLPAPIPHRNILYLCGALICLRMILAACQWMGRLYVLTNRRLLWISGVLRVNVVQCPLADVRATGLSATLLERTVGIGSLLFELRGDRRPPGSWDNISHPKQVQYQVESALRGSR